ncbi:hypothetical protein HDU91_004643 [Kappamyces sp. JEL0680]|nr:hypothetical protein HDU91_004643 [Kappamyces sp. JEL0680]
MDIDQEEKKGYAWESEYKRSWDALLQDAAGNLTLPSQKKVRNRTQVGRVHRGLIRHLVVVVDASHGMLQQDLTQVQGVGGNRLDYVLKVLGEWSEAFFDGNPLASCLVLAMRDGLAER